MFLTISMCYATINSVYSESLKLIYMEQVYWEIELVIQVGL